MGEQIRHLTPQYIRTCVRPYLMGLASRLHAVQTSAPSLAGGNTMGSPTLAPPRSYTLMTIALPYATVCNRLRCR